MQHDDTAAKTMREEIIDICVDALRRERHPDLTRESIRSDPAHARAMIVTLRDCRPLPVIQDLVRELEPVAARGSRHGGA